MASPNRCTPKLNSDIILNVVFIVAWPSGHKIGVYMDRNRQQQTTHALAVNFKGKDCVSHMPYLGTPGPAAACMYVKVSS